MNKYAAMGFVIITMRALKIDDLTIRLTVSKMRDLIDNATLDDEQNAAQLFKKYITGGSDIGRKENNY